MAVGMFAKVAGAWVEIGAAAAGMTWAKVSGGTVTTVNNPDGSVDEVHTFTADGTLTVESPGYARVLLIGGGSAGNGGGNSWMGTPGHLIEGYLNLAAGQTPVVVGAGGTTSATSFRACAGGASKLGKVIALGGQIDTDGIGYLNGTETWAGDGTASDITGTVQYYGGCGRWDGSVVKGRGYERPNSGSGDYVNGAGQKGVVIVRVQKSAPTVSGVVASGGTETTYVGDGTNGVLGQKYRVHTFTNPTDNLVVTQGGNADVFLISGGGGATQGSGSGDGGRVYEGRVTLAAGTLPVVVGAGGPAGGSGISGASSLGGITAPGVGRGTGTGAGATPASPSAGLTRSITGTAVEYGKGAAYPPAPNTGGGYNATTSGPGAAGVVIVRYEID